MGSHLTQEHSLSETMKQEPKLINQDEAFKQNQRILELFGWKEFREGDVIWYENHETGEWSWEFPGSVIKDLIEQKLLNQPVVAKAPPSRNVVDEKLTPPPSDDSSSSHSGLPHNWEVVDCHKAPPPPRGPPPPPIENQQALGVPSSTSRNVTPSPPPPGGLGVIVPGMKNCAWHEKHSWTGELFMKVNNGCKYGPCLILNDGKLSSALSSLENTLFLHDRTGWDEFYRVIRRVFREGMVQITHHYSGGGNICVELMCECCCSYVIVEDVNSKWGSTPSELQAARVTLLSFISGCQFTNPQSNLLPQR